MASHCVLTVRVLPCVLFRVQLENKSNLTLRYPAVFAVDPDASNDELVAVAGAYVKLDGVDPSKL